MRPYRLIQRARTMRHEPTKAEAILWRWLRDYCFELKLVIELDGVGHELEQFYDVQRDGELSKMGLRVLRIKNEDLLTNPQRVADVIDGAIWHR